MKIILHTPRLYLRQFLPNDAPVLYALNQDQEVLRYTGDVPFEDELEARHFLIQYDHYQTYGYGRWAVIRQADDTYLGWCGLKFSPALQETDVGFRFFRQYWQQGYATEAAKACLVYGFAQLNLYEIVGRAHEQNSASIRVLEKIGMHFIEVRKEAGERWMVYGVERRLGV